MNVSSSGASRLPGREAALLSSSSIVEIAFRKSWSVAPHALAIALCKHRPALNSR